MANKNVRLTSVSLKVLKIFIDAPRKPRSGIEISRESGIASGTLYPILDRLEDAGWFASAWENVDPAEVGRPRRRYYTITGEGYNAANEALAPYQMPNGAVGWQI
ncbi:PadR family transcriptional regulator [Mesorhizobium sp. ISC25]|uniref:PadR family transcriptional regulator n=1 Tax=Mesorhizobium sp. ISC25 TaxID=3077335 RepID=UPI0035DD86BF